MVDDVDEEDHVWIFAIDCFSVRYKSEQSTWLTFQIRGRIYMINIWWWR